MRTLQAFLIDLLLVTLAITAALAMVTIGLGLAGYPALHVVAEWIRGTGLTGAPGWRVDLLVGIKFACPLILTGLAAGIAFRSGVLNIGAEGQSILGAMGAVAVATRLLPGLNLGWLAIPVALLAAALGGALWALVAATLQRWRGVPIVLSTILLNFVALQLLGMMLEVPLKKAGQVVQSDNLPASYWLPTFGPGDTLHIGILIAVAIAALCWLVQARTAYGFELLVTGLNPAAARLAGMPVVRRQFGVMLWSGAFAGLAGAIQVMGVEGHFLGPAPVSYGYAGIAVALLGRLHPAGIIAAALFFGLLDQGASNVEVSAYQLPHEVADIVKGLVVIVILIGTAYAVRRRTTAQEALAMDLANGSEYIVRQTLMAATPLLLAGYGELIAERAGVINIGIEGTMLMGTIVAYAAAVYAGSAAAALPAAMAAGVVFAALFALAVVWFRADQIVAGTAINILALGVSTTAWRAVQRHIAQGHPAPPLFDPLTLSPLRAIPGIGPALAAILEQYALFYAVVALGILTWLSLGRTRTGLVVRSLGDAPDACDAAGIRVRQWRTVCILLAGACSGLAGAYLSTMRNHSFQVNMTNGRGFLVLALVIFGRWNIPGFVAGTLCFGALDALQTYLAANPGTTGHIPHQLFDMLPYVATLAALAVMARPAAADTAGTAAGPIHLGRPWPEDR